MRHWSLVATVYTHLRYTVMRYNVKRRGGRGQFYVQTSVLMMYNGAYEW